MALPDDIKNNLIKLAERLKKQPKELANELLEIIKTDEKVLSLENSEHKVRYAWGILFGRYARGATTNVYFRPFLKPRARKTKDGKSVCDVVGLICRIEKQDDETEEIGDAELAIGTLWEKSADATTALESNGVYRTAMKVVDTKGGVKLGGDNVSFKKDKAKIPTKEEFFKELVKFNKSGEVNISDERRIGLSEMELNVKTSDLDFRVFNVNIVGARKGVDSNENEYGTYDISDDTLVGDLDKPLSISIWLHPDDVIYGIGSVVVFVAAFDKNAKKEGEFMINPFAILPTSLSFTMEVKVNDKKSVNVDDLDDEEKEEKVEKEEKTKKKTTDVFDDFGV
jgi:hypothetical protein